MIIVGFSEYPLDIRAMHKFSETKAANISKFAGVLIENLMLDCTQSLNGLYIKRVVYSYFCGQI